MARKTRYLQGRTGGDRLEVNNRIEVGNRQYYGWPYPSEEEVAEYGDSISMWVRDNDLAQYNYGIVSEKSCNGDEAGFNSVCGVWSRVGYGDQYDSSTGVSIWSLVGGLFVAESTKYATVYEAIGLRAYTYLNSDDEVNCERSVGIHVTSNCYAHTNCVESIGGFFKTSCSGFSVVEESYAIKIGAPYFSTVGTTNELYGLYIEEQKPSVGIVGIDWQIYSEAGRHFFGGPLLLGLGAYSYDSTNADLLFLEFEPGVDASIGRGDSTSVITYLACRNENGTLCYMYPNAAGDGIEVSTSKP